MPLQVSLRLRLHLDAGTISYPSYVEDLQDEWIQLSWPMEGGRLKDLQPGQLLRAEWDEGHKTYSFETVILRCLRNPLPSVQVRRPRRVETTERRAFHRLEIELPCRCLVITEMDGTMVPVHPPLDGQTIDLSGGGALVVLHTPLQPGDLVGVQIQLPEGRTVPALASVVHATQEDYGGYRHRVGLQFVHIKEADRDAIVQFVLARERELIRRRHT